MTEEITGQKLKSFIERVERLETEKKAISDDIKDIYLEAKSQGFDTKIMKAIVKLRKLSQEKRREETELLDLYCSAIGLEIQMYIMKHSICLNMSCPNYRACEVSAHNNKIKEKNQKYSYDDYRYCQKRNKDENQINKRA